MPELTEYDIRKITEEAVKQLGVQATPESVELVVKETVARMDSSKISASHKGEQPANEPLSSPEAGNRIIVTAFGKNQIGILAGLTSVLASNRCDIMDLSQKILQEFFTIMLLVDISNATADFETVKNAIIVEGEKLDLKVIVQHEEIFNAMHRV